MRSPCMHISEAVGLGHRGCRSASAENALVVRFPLLTPTSSAICGPNSTNGDT